MNIAALLFDLGGVLVEWDGVTPLVNLTGGRMSPEQARRFWLESSWIRRFETGLCSDLEFAAGVTADLGIDLGPEAFMKEFAAWDRGPYEGASELLKDLRKDYSLYCLSNNNRTHWQNPGIQALVRNFDSVFVSFETGLMKPDPAAFAWVLERVPESASTILFLDDNQECVDAAQSLGLEARKALGLSEVREILSTLRGWG